MYLQYTIAVFDESIILSRKCLFLSKHISQTIRLKVSQSPPSCGNPQPWCPDDPWGCHRPPPRSRWWDPWAGGMPDRIRHTKDPKWRFPQKCFEKPWVLGILNFRKPPFFLGSYIQFYFKIVLTPDLSSNCTEKCWTSCPQVFFFRSDLGIWVVQDILGELGDVDGGHHGKPGCGWSMYISKPRKRCRNEKKHLKSTDKFHSVKHSISILWGFFQTARKVRNI